MFLFNGKHFEIEFQYINAGWKMIYAWLHQQHHLLDDNAYDRKNPHFFFFFLNYPYKVTFVFFSW